MGWDGLGRERKRVVVENGENGERDGCGSERDGMRSGEKLREREREGAGGEGGREWISLFFSFLLCV